MQGVASTLGNDIHHPARGCAILCGECVFENSHLLHARQREICKDCLPAPTVIAGTAVHLEGGLPPAGTICSKQVLVHENVALIERRTIGRVQQRQVRDATIQERCLLSLLTVDAFSQLRLIG